ncbi:haloacid dehalogenase type II [Streptomyces sp. NPDC059009]|uniref:haloacid dehalogenase type II n=1 Tax=Streptomyces sp. NPDC059009 TaxID=3346694 RepID=UPI003676F58A
MVEFRDIEVEVVVFDILGTLVDEPGGLRAALREAMPASGDPGETGDSGESGKSDEASVERLLTVWQRHVEEEQRRIAQGERAYATSEVIDAEAARRVADHAGLTDPAAIARLATAGQRLPPWEDTVTGLEQLAHHVPVLGLSNASGKTLLRLDAHAGLRWHQVLSGESALAYKPDPRVYQLALDAAGCAPERVLMVAAHAWDLRAARASGLRTAHVRRPAGDPPTDSDAFDGHFEGLDDLVTALSAQAI